MSNEQLIVLVVWMCIAVAIVETVIFVIKRAFSHYNFVKNYMTVIELIVIFSIGGLVVWLQ